MLKGLSGRVADPIIVDWGQGGEGGEGFIFFYNAYNSAYTCNRVSVHM